MTNFNFAVLNLASIRYNAENIQNMYKTAKTEVIEARDNLYRLKSRDLYRNRVEESVVEEVYTVIIEYTYQAESLLHKLMAKVNRIVDQVESVYDNANKMSKEDVERTINDVKTKAEELRVLKIDVELLKNQAMVSFNNLKNDFSHEKISFDDIYRLIA